MMITGPLLAWIQKLGVQHFTLEVYLFTKATTLTPIFRLLLAKFHVNELKNRQLFMGNLPGRQLQE